jgi:hypothetical protein
MDPRRVAAAALALVALVLVLAACQPELPLGRRGGAASSTTGSAAELQVEPEADVQAAPPILRLRVTSASDADPAAFVLVRGAVGRAHVRQLASGEISKALRERLVPALTWAEGEGAARQIVLAPLAPLDLGEAYVVAAGTPSLALPFRVAETDEIATLTRVWPPPDEGATTDLAVYCEMTGKSEPLAVVELPVELAPIGRPGTLRTGAMRHAGASCLRFEAEVADAGDVDEGPLVLPPLVEVGDRQLRVDPRPLVRRAAPPPPLAPLACEEGELSFGLGCARVEDDRLVARAPAVPLLWAIAGEGVDLVLATGPGQPFIVSPLPPISAVSLTVGVYDVAGRRVESAFAAVTEPPRPHVVLNEVLADAIGPEPGQEWVELVNDGLVSAELEGYVLGDIGGATVLPAATLAPGAFALVVNAAFLEDDELDVSPAPGTLILRVDKLGKNGLSNAGEPLRLSDASGHVVSRFPAMKSPKAGLSVARVAPRAPDGLAASFAIAKAGATPGATNAF